MSSFDHPRTTLLFKWCNTICAAALTILLTTAISQASPGSEATAPTPYQSYYNSLEQRLKYLETTNPASQQILSASIAFMLDMALELTHAWALQKHGPDYFYQAPLTGPTGLEHTTRDILAYTLTHGHVPALLMGATVWLSENFTGLPSLQTTDSLVQIAIISGAMAGGYGLLFQNMIHQGLHGSHTNISGHPLLKRLEPSGRPWFMAAYQLDTMKSMLQTAAITIMVTVSYLRRMSKKVEVQDVRNSLAMARERVRRESLRASNELPTYLPEFAIPGINNNLQSTKSFQLPPLPSLETTTEEKVMPVDTQETP